METINEVFVIRNYIINILGQATLESYYKSDLISLIDVAVLGGGFNGIEYVGELNRFVKDAIKNTYYNFDSSKN